MNVKNVTGVSPNIAIHWLSGTYFLGLFSYKMELTFFHILKQNIMKTKKRTLALNL